MLGMSEPVAIRTFGFKYEGESMESFPDVEGYFPLYYIAAEVNFNCVFAEEYCAFQFQEFHFIWRKKEAIR